jgi:hypothetical protein
MKVKVRSKTYIYGSNGKLVLELEERVCIIKIIHLFVRCQFSRMNKVRATIYKDFGRTKRFHLLFVFFAVVIVQNYRTIRTC